MGSIVSTQMQCITQLSERALTSVFNVVPLKRAKRPELNTGLEDCDEPDKKREFDQENRFGVGAIFARLPPCGSDAKLGSSGSESRRLTSSNCGFKFAGAGVRWVSMLRKGLDGRLDVPLTNTTHL